MDENNTTEAVEEKPQEAVYSQMSMEYVAKQVKKARKKGFIQGLLIAVGIVVIAMGIKLCVDVVQMVINGSLYAKLLGSTASSVLDRKSIEKIDNLYGLIEGTYLEDVDKETLREGMYRGMLEALDDPYSEYYNKEEFAQMMESTSGTFEGIGAYLTHPLLNHLSILKKKEGDTTDTDRKDFYIPAVRVLLLLIFIFSFFFILIRDFIIFAEQVVFLFFLIVFNGHKCLLFFIKTDAVNIKDVVIEFCAAGRVNHGYKEHLSFICQSDLHPVVEIPFTEGHFNIPLLGVFARARFIDHLIVLNFKYPQGIVIKLLECIHGRFSYVADAGDLGDSGIVHLLACIDINVVDFKFV